MTEYIKVTDGNVQPYSVAQLRKDNPTVSFPKEIPLTTLGEYGVYPLVKESDPNHDPRTQRVVDGVIEDVNGQWTQRRVVDGVIEDVNGQWTQRRVVEDMSEQEVLSRVAQIDTEQVQDPAYLASVVRLLASKLLDMGTLTDEEKQQVAVAYDAWEPELAVAVGDILRFEGELYRVEQAHTTAAQWLPPNTPSLYTKVYDPDAGPQPWVQPINAETSYDIGEEVTHDNPNDGGAIWVYSSNINANTTEPGRDGTFDRWWTPVRKI